MEAVDSNKQTNKLRVKRGQGKEERIRRKKVVKKGEEIIIRMRTFLVLRCFSVFSIHRSHHFRLLTGGHNLDRSSCDHLRGKHHHHHHDHQDHRLLLLHRDNCNGAPL